MFGAESWRSLRTGLSGSTRRERSDLRTVSEVGERVDGSGDLTDERGTKSEVFRASGESPLRASSDIADEIAESLIEMSGRAHTSFRSGIRAEGTGSCVADSADGEGEGSGILEVSDSSLLRAAVVVTVFNKSNDKCTKSLLLQQ